MSDPNRHRHGDKNDDLICEACAADERAHIRAELLAKYEINEVIDVADMLAIIDKEGSEPQCGNPFCENGYDEMNNEPCACIIDEDDSDD